MKKARIGFIGAGWWATSNHMPVLSARPDVELAGVCRLGRDELRQVQERFGFRFATEDYRELLDKVELDGVVVASPHTLHHEHASAALSTGLHVMCEKPMTTQADHARELVHLAGEKRLQLLVPYGWHYKDFTQQARQWVEEGRIGRIEHALCHMASPLRGLLSGAGMKVADISGQSGGNLFDPDPKTWADPQVAGGGYGHAQLSHASGLMCWISGLRVQTVYADMSAPGAQVELDRRLQRALCGRCHWRGERGRHRAHRSGLPVGHPALWLRGDAAVGLRAGAAGIAAGRPPAP